MRAFLSYSSVDRPLARRIAEMLRTRGVEVWFDDRDLLPGEPLGAALVSGITASDHFVALITKASAESDWVRFELGSVLPKVATRQVRLVPLVFDEAAIPQELEGYKWIGCADADDARRAIDSAFRVDPSERTAPEIPDSHPAPRYGLRLIPTENFRSAQRLGPPEREYVLVGDYFQLRGRSLREVQESIFHGQYFDRVAGATERWTGVVFEIGKVHSKSYDVFPATWKAIYRILTDPKRCGVFPASKEATQALRKEPRDYRRDDGYPWQVWVQDQCDMPDLERLCGLYNECFFGEDGFGESDTRIYLVRNLDTKLLNARTIDMGTPDDGLRVE